MLLIQGLWSMVGEEASRIISFSLSLNGVGRRDIYFRVETASCGWHQQDRLQHKSHSKFIRVLISRAWKFLYLWVSYKGSI